MDGEFSEVIDHKTHELLLMFWTYSVAWFVLGLGTGWFLRKQWPKKKEPEQNSTANKIYLHRKRGGQSGNILTVLLAAVALSAVISMTLYQNITGPLATMTRVTKKNMADMQMLSASKIAIIDASNQTASGDCDGDGSIEPKEWRTGTVGTVPTNGGLIPLTIGAPVTDPWGTDFGYCVWDVGTYNDPSADHGCGAPAKRLKGTDNPTAGSSKSQTVMALISAGPNRQFETTCKNYVDGTSDVITTSGDDIVMRYTYNEAANATSSLWTLKTGAPDTATIAKSLEVTGSLITATAATLSGKLIAGGGVLVGTDAAVTTCNSGNTGLVRYNATLKTLEVCNGTTWALLGGKAGGANGYIQFNDNNLFEGSSNLYWDNTNSRLGIGTTTPSTLLSLGGSSAQTFWMERNSTSDTAGNSLTVQAGGASSGGTNRNGGNLILSSGIATGSGTSQIQFQTATGTSSGTADRTPVTRMTIDGSGNVGIGAAAASGVALDVGSQTTAIRPAVGTTAQQPTCNGAITGAFRFDTNQNTMTMCDGTSWRLIAAATSSGCTGPSAFSFTNIIDQSLSTLINSNIITPSGCNATLSASVSGSGTPQISVNGGTWTTSTSISPGQTVQVRLTTGSSINTTFSAVVTIGSTSTTWTVTTKAGNTRIFQTSATYNGNLGGLSGADTICQTAAVAAGYTGSYWMAILSDSISNAKDRLSITYPVVKASSTSTTISSSNLWSGSISNTIGTLNSTWTGSDSGGNLSGSPCNDWASNLSSYITSYGYGTLTTSQWLTYSTTNCGASLALYCIEQPHPGCGPTFSFTNSTGVSPSTLTTSNTITPTGCFAPSNVLVTGPSGNPQISINGGAWTTRGILNAGDTIAVRMTASANYGGTYKARVSIGTSSTIWTVTTAAATGSKVFATGGAFSGNLGGLSGADAICQGAATTLGYSGTWKAILSSSTTNAKDRLTITYPVTRASDGAVISPSNLWSGSLANPILTTNYNVATGTDSVGNKIGSCSGCCSDWTSSGSAGSARGIGGTTVSGWTYVDAYGYCQNNNFYLYCISQ